MSNLNSMIGLTITDTTEGEYFDMYQDDFEGSLALCDGDGACCCCCCCCC